MGRRVASWLAVLVIAVGLAAVFVGLRSGKDKMAFAGSCGVIVGLLGGAAAAMFPVMLHSTIDPAHSMTAHGNASGAYGLGRALWWWPVAMVLSVSYAVWAARRHRGRAGVIDEPSSPEALRKGGLV
jgi:cytochrome d ubiquinol oxidase subunit II